MTRGAATGAAAIRHAPERRGSRAARRTIAPLGIASSAGISRRAGGRLVAALAALLLAGCGRDEPRPRAGAPRGTPRHLRHGVFHDLVLHVRPHDEGGSFFLDRFETTRRDWAEYLQQTGTPMLPEWEPLLADAARGPGTLPMARVTLPQARAFAAWRFARLPRHDELAYAIGGGGQPRYRYPWGDRDDPASANTGDLGLGRPTPVGVFESGRSGEGCYDLIGNVAEWTESVPYWFHSAWPPGLGASGVGPYQGQAEAWSALPPSQRWWRRFGVLPGAVWAAAVLERELPREVVGAHYGILVFEEIADRGAALLLELLPQEWSDRVGLRLAADPGGLLADLLAADAAADPEVRDELARFLARPLPRAFLGEVWPTVRSRLRQSNATAEFLAAQLVGER